MLSTTWSVIEGVTSKRHRPYLGNWLGAALYPVEISAPPVDVDGPYDRDDDLQAARVGGAPGDPGDDLGDWLHFQH